MNGLFLKKKELWNLTLEKLEYKLNNKNSYPAAVIAKKV